MRKTIIMNNKYLKRCVFLATFNSPSFFNFQTNFMKKILLIASISIFAFSSCDKDDDDDCQTNVANLSGTYKLTALKYKPSGMAEIDLYATLDACEKDDLTILNSNGTYSYQDAGTVCVPDGSYAGTWSLSGNTITVDGDQGTISSFDCNIVTFYQESGGDRITFTYDKQ